MFHRNAELVREGNDNGVLGFAFTPDSLLLRRNPALLVTKSLIVEFDLEYKAELARNFIDMLASINPLLYVLDSTYRVLDL